MASGCKSQYMDVFAGRRIFVDHLQGNRPKDPCVIYVPGFLSHRESEKGKSLLEYCSRVGLEFIRYDPEGFGKSEFENHQQWANIQFRHWFEDCMRAMEASKNKKIILIGSSMGGWISLLTYKKISSRIAGMVLIAPAQNFIARNVEEGNTLIDNPIIKSMVDIKGFAKKSEELSIPLDQNINEVNVPVRIFHGMKDDIIPSECSVDLINSLRGDDIELTLIKSGDHRLNEHMNKITESLEVIIQKSNPMSE
ncbi:palmitoyl-protein thioesterase ABHD10, mitochondrial isoform X2 [Lepeophtheirus salmonis]|nr:palmitoyl-protein thioesterase ABHD10, mitochondrial-like isoform X2 [Lepeophtheirus salmonis]